MHLARRTNFGVRPLEGEEGQLNKRVGMLTIQYVNIIGGRKAASCPALLDSPGAARRAALRGRIYYVMRVRLYGLSEQRCEARVQ